VGWRGMDRNDVAQYRDRWRALRNAVMKIWVPQNEGNFLTSYGPLSFSPRTLLHGVKMTLSHLHRLYEIEFAGNINVEVQLVRLGRSRLWPI
jgi:hypothetical protein